MYISKVRCLDMYFGWYTTDNDAPRTSKPWVTVNLFDWTRDPFDQRIWFTITKPQRPSNIYSYIIFHIYLVSLLQNKRRNIFHNTYQYKHWLCSYIINCWYFYLVLITCIKKVKCYMLLSTCIKVYLKNILTALQIKINELYD